MKLPGRFPVEMKRGSVAVRIYRTTNKGYEEFKLVYYGADGKRKFKAFADYADAKSLADHVMASFATGNADTLVLSSKEAAIYRRTLDILRPIPVDLDIAAREYAAARMILGQDSLRDAVAYYVKHRQPLVKKTVQEVVDELIEKKKEKRASHDYIVDLRSRLDAFAEAFGYPITDVTGHDVEKYVRSLAGEERTRFYRAAYGPSFVLNLSWRQRDPVMADDVHSHFVSGWSCDLLSWIDGSLGWTYGNGDAEFTLYLGNGFTYKLLFTGSNSATVPEYLTGMRAVRTVVGGIITKLEVYFRNGSVDTYDLVENGVIYRLSSRKDATTKALTFMYDDPYSSGDSTRLTRVTAADGAQFNFSYPTSGDLLRITGVTGPNSRSVSFSYSTIGSTVVLSGITDAVGMASSLNYDSSTWWITQVITPYGTNSFSHFDAGFCNPDHPLNDLTCAGVDRAVTITEPEGSKQVYLFYDNPYDFLGTSSQFAGIIPSSFASDQVPQYTTGVPPIQTLDTFRDQRNSHYWNRQQTAQLSTLNLANLTAADYRISRTRHWLMQFNSVGSLHTLSWELPASHDGSNEVNPIFYDYKDKPTGSQGTYPDSAYCGTNNLLSVISRRIPDGTNITTAFTFYERNEFGMKTNVIEGWVKNGVGTVYRTNTYRYATGTSNPAVDGLLLVQQKGPYGEVILGRALHSTYNDQIRYETNAVGEVTTFDYDSNRRLTTKQTQAGHLSTYSYDGITGRLSKIVDSASGTPIRTNSFSWLNGYLRTHTDPRGFTRTFDFDFLSRLAKISYPDGTSEDFTYSLPANTGFNSSGSAWPILDLVTYKDRLTNYSQTLPNRIRQIEKIKEPSATTPGQYGTETTITYCGCGSPTAITRASNNPISETTSFDYNFQGAIKKITFPNATTLTNTFDVLGRLSSRQDALSSTTISYDNLSRVISLQNGAGAVLGLGYDLRDRVLASTNHAGVWVTNPG